uniref:Serine/threonine-protein phosphatase n=1 Tax=Macrostomum lignano TaxID=282301 RepID=A0A1I8JRD7_9PLAT
PASLRNNSYNGPVSADKELQLEAEFKLYQLLNKTGTVGSPELPRHLTGTARYASSRRDDLEQPWLLPGLFPELPSCLAGSQSQIISVRNTSGLANAKCRPALSPCARAFPARNWLCSSIIVAVLHFDEAPITLICANLLRIAMRQLASLPRYGHLSSSTISSEHCGRHSRQFHDLLRILIGWASRPSPSTYSSATISIGENTHWQVIVLLLTLMLVYPNSVYLLRGNHEAANVCCRYGFFKTSDVQRFGNETGTSVLMGFSCAASSGCRWPASSISRFSAVTAHIADIRAGAYRSSKPLGAACDLLWADPMPYPQFCLFKAGDQPAKVHWTPQQARLLVHVLAEALESALHSFGAGLLVRGHQVAQEGFMSHLNRGVGGMGSNASRRLCDKSPKVRQGRLSIHSVQAAPHATSGNAHERQARCLQIDKDKINMRKPGSFFVLRSS